ncbi:hypothetical protein [Winogradskyella algicola]|uniref:hypothetical protein n=1 Tax=Winogradskyella algicola TaxID=2575815 RepID=UPI0011090CCB|nr:hypothetical protein [Winogradskyella algicola]
MKKKLIFILILFTVIFTSCEKEPLPADIETIIFGEIYDSTNDLPIINKKLKIAEFREISTLSGVSSIFNGYIDSTYTNINGAYNLPFKTSGNGSRYVIQIEYNKEVHIFDSDETIQDEIIGQQLELNFEALQLYPVDLRVITTDIINQEITVYQQFPGGITDRIPPATQNSVRRIWIDKNIVNNINFSIREPNPNLNYDIEIPINDTTELYEYEVEINSSDFE